MFYTQGRITGFTEIFISVAKKKGILRNMT